MRQLSAAVNYVATGIHCYDSPCNDGIKAMQGDGPAVPRLSSFAASWTSQRFSRGEGQGKSKSNQSPSKVAGGQQCPGTSLAPYPPWRYRVIAATLTVFPNTFFLQQWRWEPDFWHWWRSRNTPLTAQRHAARPQPGPLLAFSRSPFPNAWSSQHWN